MERRQAERSGKEWRGEESRGGKSFLLRMSHWVGSSETMAFSVIRLPVKEGRFAKEHYLDPSQSHLGELALHGAKATHMQPPSLWRAVMQKVLPTSGKAWNDIGRGTKTTAVSKGNRLIWKIAPTSFILKINRTPLHIVLDPCPQQYLIHPLSDK